jgi:hypothetical protein
MVASATFVHMRIVASELAWVGKIIVLLGGIARLSSV